MSSPGSLPEHEPEELVQFREAWKAELQLKKHPSSDHHGPGASTNPVDSSLADGPSQPGPSSQTIAGTPAVILRNRTLSSAVETYRRAVQLEQQGQFDAALRLYRQVCKTVWIMDLWN
jgi:F-box protein 9